MSNTKTYLTPTRIKHKKSLLSAVTDGWIQLTRPDSIENLGFAIEQLETRDKAYVIRKHADSRVSVWVRRR